jgi:Ca-activated chloride channel family protein
MFRFEHPEFLWALTLLPLLGLGFLWRMRVRRRRLSTYAAASSMVTVGSSYSISKPRLKAVLWALAYACLIIGSANPQLGSRMEDARKEGVELMVALDVSNSMRAQDLSPNRLEHAKQAIAQLTQHLQGDRLGIVVFAGEAYVQLPITNDYDAAKLFLDQIDPSMIPTQGTAIGAAIEKCVESFNKKSPLRKAIILMTDGENFEDNAVDATLKALEVGIVVHAVGMGSPDGVPIPEGSPGRNLGYKRDAEGNIVVTRLNETMLQEIVAAGKGTYVRDDNSNSALGRLYESIGKMERKVYAGKVYTDYESYFQWFIFISILLFLIEMLLSERRSLWWDKINLFGNSSSSKNL